MTTLERQQDEQLNAIGMELFEHSQAGTLDFTVFRSLLGRAIAAAGADNEHLEMFCHYATGEGWWDWMVQELRRAPSRQVA